ncbi:MAG: DUF3501 family protein [Planctomycetes bacterium]|nr:DUF3501 family protein [Planctomycetota bacterium]
MKKVARADLWPLETYESRRDAIRKKMIALKSRRRVLLPPNISLTFENRGTVWYQIQEMLRAERIVKIAAIRHELRTYNELVPPQNGLRATLFIEIPDLHKLRDALPRFRDLPRLGNIYFEIEPRRGEVIKIPAEFDPEQYSEERVSAVQYLTFRFTREACDALRGRSARLHLVCAHPANRARVPVSAATRRELHSDLFALPASPGVRSPR